jgi:outer membrane protein
MLRAFSLVAAILVMPGMAAAQVSNLYDVYASAIDADPRVRIAQHQVELGKAQADSALGVMLPQANLTANFSDNDVQYDSDIIEDSDYTGKRYGIQVRQILFNWAALAERARARQVIAQRESELLDVVSMLLLDVSERYFNVLLAQSELGLIQSEKELINQQVRETEERFERQLVRVTDLLETQARADAVRTDEIEAENNVALAQESLSELTGTRIGDIAPLRRDFDLPQLTNSMKFWTDRAMANNALLQARRDAVLAAKETVEAAKGGHYPRLDLVFSDQTTDTGFDNQQQPERETTYIAIDITMPLYAGGTTSARVREAWAEYYIAREQEEQSRREVMRRSREAWLNTRSSRKRVDSAALGVQSASKSFEAMNKSFTYGTVTAADVLEALASQTRARRDYQGAVYEFIVNWLLLKRESGFLETDDLEQVNGWLVANNTP